MMRHVARFRQVCYYYYLYLHTLFFVYKSRVVKITEVHWIFLALRVTKAPEHVEGPKALRNKEPVSRTNATGGQQRPAEYFTSKLQEE
mmetsp:Transcript_21891/g.31410  ORF Transcript_21891/g.31410 Transcript_21891/m.31410 type:complete len:88 (-) Transcript_21891:75-338(-)